MDTEEKKKLRRKSAHYSVMNGFSLNAVTVLLVDDQPIMAEALKHMLASEKDVSFHYCENPEKALDAAKDCQPTVILLDLIMPGFDGLSLVKLFREDESTRDIPMIVLSSREESDIKSEAFSLGANDYMVKLPEKPEVVARIRYHSKAYNALMESQKAYKALLENQARMRSDLDDAERYVRSIIPNPLDEKDIQTEWVYIPSHELGGDTFGYHWIDDDCLAFYLLDVCGHGVRAALLSVTVLNILRSHTLPDVDFRKPDSVLNSLNHAFDMKEHYDMFFTLWYGVYNRKTKELNYSTAGHHAALWIANEKEKRLRTDNMVIGTHLEVPFYASSIKLEVPGELYIFSDGVYEIDRADGSGQMSLDDFSDIIHEVSEKEGNHALGAIVERVQKIQGKEDFDDDFSILKLTLK